MPNLYQTKINKVYLKKRVPKLSEILNGNLNDQTCHDTVYNKRYSTTTRIVDKELVSNKFAKEFAWYNKESFCPTKEDYTEFHIPKKSGGIRIISEPNEKLKTLQRKLAKHLRSYLDRAESHTNVHAYVPKRNTNTALKKHQQNKSRWFLKLDIHDFFGSTTKEFVYKMLNMQENFYEEDGSNNKKCFDICFLDNVLPQGAPTSPILSNLAMIPIDYEITQWCRQKEIIYTRFADDMLFSSRYSFYFGEVVEEVTSIFKTFGAPYVLNKKKLRYGSYAGRNWNLGLMYNKDEKITVGHEKKKYFKAMLTKLASEKEIDLKVLNKLSGLYSYYHSIEPEYFEYLMQKYSKKFNRDLDYLFRHKEDNLE